MANFFLQQLDYIFFCYGLAFILLMAVCFIMHKTEKNIGLNWILLGFFGLIHGTNEWLDMHALSLGDSRLFSSIRMLIMLISFLVLTEFGRSGLRCRHGRGPGPWIYLPVLAFIILTGYSDSQAINAVIRYSTGLVGGGLAAAALWRAGTIETYGYNLKNAAVVMVAYALAAGAVVPEAPFFPASMLNHASFFTFTGLPIQLLRGGLAVTFTAMVWSFHQRSLSRLPLDGEQAAQVYTGRQLTVLVCLLLLVGAFGTYYFGLEALREARRDLLHVTRTAAAAFNIERIKQLSLAPGNMGDANYLRIRQQLINLKNVNPHFFRMRLIALQDQQAVIIADSADVQASHHKEPWTVYKHPPVELLEAFDNGAEVTTEPYWDEDGTFVSGYVAVREPVSGKTLAVVGVDAKSAAWQDTQARYRLTAITVTLCFLLLVISFFIIRQKMLEASLLLADSRKRLDEAKLQKQLELEQLNRSLEEIVALRTAKLTESNRELQHFAYIASHDLQEPLRTITSFVQLLAKRYQGKLDKDADEFIGYITDGAMRMKVLINDLLAYSRVDSKGKPFAEFDCQKTLDHTLSSLHQAIVESRAEITRDHLPVMHGDQVQISQVFQNLIGNALKFHGSEPPRIHIGCIEQPEHWMISVSDNGIGIEARFFDRIFDIFQRLHSREQYDGTGIGLAVCKKIVDRHRGIIRVESEPGRGSTFTFIISKDLQDRQPSQ